MIAPFECTVCNCEGNLLCVDCAQNLEKIPSRCYRCHKLTADFRVCVSCRRASSLYSVRPVTVYKNGAKALVSRLKFHGARSAAKEIAALFPVDIPTDCVVVPVPTATSRTRQRGYDQAKLIARHFARRNRLTYLDCLARSGQSHQVGAKRTQRLNQLKTAYRVKSGCSVRSLEIILIDDVLTTGATLEVAANCLKAQGAKRVHGRVFAQA